MATFEIVEGGRYVMRNGEVTPPLHRTRGCTPYPWRDLTGRSWAANGQWDRVGGASPRDLIAEHCPQESELSPQSTVETSPVASVASAEQQENATEPAYRRIMREQEAMVRENDAVNHPPHYTSHPSGVECITITRHFGFNLGNVIKYLWRAPLKGATVEDLKKARWYLDDEITRLESTTKT